MKACNRLGLRTLAVLIVSLVALPSSALAAPTLSVSPSSVGPGGAVTATWSGLTAPINVDDWLGYFTPGASNANPIAWLRLDCTQTSGATPANGSCSFTMPTTTGTYEFRLVDAGSASTLASVNPVTVSIGTPTPTGTPTATFTATPTPGPGTPTVTPTPIPPTPTPLPPTATPNASGASFAITVSSPVNTIRIPLSNLPARILVTARSMGAYTNPAAVSLGIQFNDDSSANYAWNNQISNGSTGSASTLIEQAAASNSDNEVRIRVGWLPDAASPSGAWSSYVIIVQPHNQAAFYGGASLGFGPTMSFQGWGTRYAADRASSPSEVTSVTLMQDTGDSFAIGTTVRAEAL